MKYQFHDLVFEEILKSLQFTPVTSTTIHVLREKCMSCLRQLLCNDYTDLNGKILDKEDVRDLVYEIVSNLLENNVPQYYTENEKGKRQIDHGSRERYINNLNPIPFHCKVCGLSYEVHEHCAICGAITSNEFHQHCDICGSPEFHEHNKRMVFITEELR